MKKIVVLSLISVGYFINAQSISNSPYAAFGIGDVKYDNTIEFSAMGGVSTAYISDFNSNFNFANPANNANFELTSLKLEATNENNYFTSNYNNTKSTKNATYLSNITLAFPISSKLKVGFLYQPYSAKNYEILNSSTNDQGVISANRFSGSGILNTAQVALSYKINNQIAVGARANYYFGNLIDLNEIATSDAALINGYETKSTIKNANFTLGTSYQRVNTRNDHKLTLGATATLGNTSDMNTSYTNSTYYYAIGDEKANETIIDQKNIQTKNLLPMQFSLGAGYGSEYEWFFSTQLDYKKGESITVFGQPFTYKDSYRISAGGWYLPNFNNFRNYFSRVVYRYGAFYEKGSLQISGTNINKFGISAGVLLPFKSSNINKMSGLEIGVELGKRGTLNNNLINQNFINLKIGFNFADKWFRKNLYN